MMDTLENRYCQRFLCQKKKEYICCSFCDEVDCTDRCLNGPDRCGLSVSYGRSKRREAIDWNKAMDLYNAGMSDGQIAKELCCHRKTVGDWRKRKNLPVLFPVKTLQEYGGNSER